MIIVPIYIRISLKLDSLCSCDAISRTIFELFFANITNTVFPRYTILHPASTINQVVLTIAFLAFEAIDIKTSFQFAHAAFEFKIGKTISALPPLISHASLFHDLAHTIQVEIVSAATGNTTIFVVSLAVGDFTVSIG